MQQSVSQSERTGAIFAHVSGLLAMVGLPFVHVVGPLVFYLIARDGERPFALEHAREALNFQITASIVWLVVLVGYVGFFVGAAMRTTTTPAPGDAAAFIGAFVYAFACLAVGLLYGLFDLVCVVLAAIAASNGRPYRYPFSLRFVR